MTKIAADRKRPIFDHLHPDVYRMLAVLAVWFVCAAWSFDASGYVALILAIVSAFIFVAVMLPTLLNGSWNRHVPPGVPHEKPPTMHDWAEADFDTWQSKLDGAHAAIEVLLPIAAVAVGMTVLSIVLHLDIA